MAIPFDCRVLSDAERERCPVSHEIDICPSQKRRLNLSGGGVAFESKEALPNGTSIEMMMCLPMDPPVSIAAYGVVLRCEPLSGTYKIAVKFAEADNALTSLICRFLFEEERARVQVRKGDE